MREELRGRYGIDLDRTDPRTLTAEVEAWRQRLEQQRRQEVDQQRAVDTTERVEPAGLLDQAAREDRQADAARDHERRADMGLTKPLATTAG